ncbi:MAG: thioesterase family protein [Pseudolabrys sp.]|jgi:acyl-CoA thioesterase FadM
MNQRPSPISFSTVSPSVWSCDVNIYHGQCDPAGIVYTPIFFDIFNRVIEDWYRDALGLSYYDFIGPRSTGLGYANAHCDFFVTCTMGDTIRVAVTVERIGNSSFTLVLHAFNGGGEALRGRFTVVTTDLRQHRPIPLPDDLRQALLDYSGAGD